MKIRCPVCMGSGGVEPSFGSGRVYGTDKAYAANISAICCPGCYGEGMQEATPDAAIIATELQKKPGCYNGCPFDDLCANDVKKIQEIERMSAECERDKLLNLLDSFTNVAIKICDEPHGKLSNPMKVKGMKAANHIFKGIVKECRTKEGFKRVERSFRAEKTRA